MPEPTLPNIGLADAVVRFLAGPLLIAGAGYGVHVMGAHWALTLLHAVILGVYLLMTAAIRTCFFYLAADISTLHKGTGERVRVRAGKPV